MSRTELCSLIVNHFAVIPYDNLFSNPSNPSLSYPHKRVHGTITSLHPHHVTYIPHAKSGPTASTPSGSRPVKTPEEDILHFDYAVYALGSHLPSPIDLWGSPDTDLFSFNARSLACSELEKGPQSTHHNRPYSGTKLESISCLRSRQRRIEAAQHVLVVGGGALGIRKPLFVLWTDATVSYLSPLIF